MVSAIETKSPRNSRRRTTKRCFLERLERRRLLASRPPIPAPDKYEVNSGETLAVEVAPPGWSTLLFDDFETEPSPAWRSKSTETSPSETRSYLGPFRNEDVSIGIHNIPAHLHVRIEFDLVLVGPWEGLGTTSGRDRWFLKFTESGERTVLDTTFSNLFDVEDSTQLFPSGRHYPSTYRDDYPTQNPPGTGAASINDLMYEGGDSTYHFDLELPHRPNTMTVTFGGRDLETGVEKYWGLDNVRVSVAAFPGPETGVLANDTDYDDPFLQAELATPPAYGTLSFMPDGRFRYQPDDNFVGLDSFTYRASDGDSSSDPVEVRLIVRNDEAAPPQARHDSFRIPMSLSLSTPASPQAPIEVFFDDFEDAPSPAWSSQERTVAPEDERTFLGRFGNDEVRLDLDNLPPHEVVTVEFDLFIINSWDGNSESVGDRWMLTTDDNVELINTTFSSHVYDQSYPDDFGIGSHPPHTGASEVNALGFPDFYGTGDVYRISRTFSHVGDSVALIFRGQELQYLDDESWGLDNVRVFAGGPSVLSGDRYERRNEIQFELVSAPKHGDLTLGQDGQFEYVPDVNYVGIDEFKYRLIEGGRSSNIGRVVIDVFPPEHEPATGVYAVAENGELSVPGIGDQGASVVVFEDRFDNGVSEPWLSVDFGRLAQPYGGFLGDFGNNEASFSIDELPTHSRLEFQFDVYTFGSWGGDDEEITIALEGYGEIATLNVGGWVPPTRERKGVKVVATANESVEVDWSNLGEIVDATGQFQVIEAHRVRVAFSHESDAARIFTIGSGVKGVDYESWGLDNVSLVARYGLLASEQVEQGFDSVVALETAPSYGELTIEPNGAFTYVPDPGFVGVDFFVYRVETNGSPTSESTVRIEVLPDEELLPGDANRDGVVDLLDFAALKEGFGTQSGWEGGDFDWSGETDLRDFAILKSAFGSDDE